MRVLAALEYLALVGSELADKDGVVVAAQNEGEAEPQTRGADVSLRGNSFG